MACTDLDKAAPAAGDDRHLHEECGVFGVYSNVTADVASLAYYALYALQHRGQESAGIVVNDDGLFRSWRDVGLVSDVFPKERLRSLGLGNIAVGHVRYGTTGSDNKRNVQPILVNHYKGRMALAHNGNLTNSQELRLQLESQGSIFHCAGAAEAQLHRGGGFRRHGPSGGGVFSGHFVPQQADRRPGPSRLPSPVHGEAEGRQRGVRL